MTNQATDYVADDLVADAWAALHDDIGPLAIDALGIVEAAYEAKCAEVAKINCVDSAAVEQAFDWFRASDVIKAIDPHYSGGLFEAIVTIKTGYCAVCREVETLKNKLGALTVRIHELESENQCLREQLNEAETRAERNDGVPGVLMDFSEPVWDDRDDGE